MARLKREQDREVCWMKGIIVLSDSDSDGGDNCTSSSDDQDPTRQPQGHRPDDEVVIPPPSSMFISILVASPMIYYDLLDVATDFCCPSFDHV